MIESDKILINDFNIIEEMSTFSKKSTSEDDRTNDDLMMCLVFLKVKASNQEYFKELTDSNIRNQLYVEQQNLIEQDMHPFEAFVDDGIERP